MILAAQVTKAQGGFWCLTFDMSGGAKGAKRLWDVRSMERLGAMPRARRHTWAELKEPCSVAAQWLFRKLNEL